MPMLDLQHAPKECDPGVYGTFSRLVKWMMQRHLVAVWILLVLGAYLLLYHIRSSGLSLDGVRVFVEDAFGNTDKDGNTTNDELTAEGRLRKRWKTQGNCTIQPEVPGWDKFYDAIDKEKPCEKMKLFGGLGNDTEKDGSKAVCMTPSMAPKPEACTVLSFGIANEWSFDDAMATWGCNVFSFDPTMAAEDHLRGSMVHFYHQGLSDRKAIITIKDKRVPVDSYRGILTRIGLLNKTIDYLKIDIEKLEIEFLKNVLDEDQELLMNVKQIGMEINPYRSTMYRNKIWTYIHRLQCLGFRQVDSRSDRKEGTSYLLANGRIVSCCYEMLWINEAYL